jgi:hypothetical protein
LRREKRREDDEMRREGKLMQSTAPHGTACMAYHVSTCDGDTDYELLRGSRFENG